MCVCVVVGGVGVGVVGDVYADDGVVGGRGAAVKGWWC